MHPLPLVTSMCLRKRTSTQRAITIKKIHKLPTEIIIYFLSKLENEKSKTKKMMKLSEKNQFEI